MQIFSLISDFLLATWLFSITYDWFHIIINTCMLSILLRVIMHMDISRAIMLSFSAHFFAFLTYAVFAISLFFNYLITRSMPVDLSETWQGSDLFLACVYLAFVYGMLQSFFLFLMHVRSKIPLRNIVGAVWLSNGISAVLSYCVIRMLIFPAL